MKTENLTWAEAIRAYANGERIRDKDGDEFWIKDGRANSRSSNLFAVISCPAPDHEPYSIVKEPKSLTFDEAVRCEAVRIEPPKDAGEPFLMHRRWIWTLNDLALIDLAVRKDWKITDASQ